MDDKTKLSEIHQRIVNGLEALRRELGGELPDCALFVELKDNSLSVEHGGHTTPSTPKTATKE